MAKRTKYGSPPDKHFARAKHAATWLRSVTRLARQDLKRGDCKSAIKNIAAASHFEGQLYAEREGAGRPFHGRGAVVTPTMKQIWRLQEKLESCFTKKKIVAALKTKGNR